MVKTLSPSNIYTNEKVKHGLEFDILNEPTVILLAQP
jgi:hypothetical protein